MIRIITDSTCEAPPDVLRHPALYVLPLCVVFGKEALRDGIEISRQEFWQRLPKSDPLPTTSQATLGEFAALFEKAVAAGEEVVAVVLSSKLSGTHSSAIAARELHPEWPVDVLDSRSVSIGLGLMVQEALAMVDAGAGRDEIVARMLTMRDHVRVMFVVETLEYLQRGGRIGKAAAFVGTLLAFKPLLSIVDGEILPVARVRTKAKALDMMREMLLQQVPARGSQVRVFLTEACVAEEAAQFASTLAGSFQAADPAIHELGPVLGVHVGPGAIGAGVYAER